MKRIIALLVCLIVLASTIFIYAENENQKDAILEENVVKDIEQDGIVYLYTYENYMADHKGYENAKSSFILEGNAAQITGGEAVAEYESRKGVALIGSTGTLSWNIDVPETGYYNMLIDCNTQLKANRTFELALMIDGKVPFDQANYISIPKVWEDKKAPEGRFLKDKRGNELTPEQLEVKTWQSKYFIDGEGYYSEPFLVFLDKGAHIIELKVKSGNIAIDSVTFKAPEFLPPYEEYKRSNDSKGYKRAKDAYIELQAEETLWKSDPVLHPTYDRSSSASKPSSAFTVTLNTIGQFNWRYTGQWIKYEFEVPEDGLYKISMRARQSLVRGVSVSRRIYIDDKVPFKEFESYKFEFNDNWYIKELGDRQPYEIYLTKGKHTLKMEVAPSNPEIIRDLQKSVFELSNLYREIIMITSTVPDEYRDYSIHKQIPNFNNRVSAFVEDLKKLRSDMEDKGYKKGGEAVIIEQIIRQLDDFVKKPDTIPSRLKMFKDNISAAGQWVYRLREQPLELDYLIISDPEVKKPKAEKGIYESIVFNVQLFIASFMNKYNVIDNEYSKDEAVEVWISQYGRDQALMIKRLVENDFAKKHNIPINVNLVQMGLIPATLTGKGPDVSIFMNPQAETINLAAREALEDISKYEGYEEVTKRFHDKSMVPYEYMGGIYGLPVVENFSMMFYRKDIFMNLGVLPPKTWDDFYALLHVLQRNNLTAGIPSTNTLMNGAFNDIMFQNLLYQKGGTYYKEGWKKTGFDTPEALAAFKQWTEFYTKYSLPVEFDPFSRFRVGEMPIIIAPYTMYNVFNIAAPEIRGMWDMVPIPGTLREDGTINRSVTAAGSGISMFKKTKNKQGAWEFMKWFTSAEVQAKFARELEIYVGPMARFDTANIEAFKELPWGEKEREKILSQWEQVIMIPQTPVSYYTVRNVAFAHRKVVYKNENPREILSFYNRDINKEISRKRKEFGID